jgi:crotonobetainyl-CoA:carnitine CoA-transferase CaiB-like acyl-CoA transferase
MDGQRLGVRMHPPTMGEHTAQVLREAGYSDPDIEALRARRAVA